MTNLELILLSLALGADCFSVSLAAGLMLRRMSLARVVRMAVLFGLFQALMPCIGWAAMNSLSVYVASFGHWIAFALLSFVGVRMICEAFRPEERRTLRPERLATQLVLAVATSIDALAIGVSMACMGYDSLGMMLSPLGMIGVGSLLLSLAGYAAGAWLGRLVKHIKRPEALGGTVLILIGIKILAQHFLA